VTPHPARQTVCHATPIQALALVDIRLLDHLVVGGMDIVSFAERWLL
jgi:DNA repair protein RadC